MKTAGGRHGNSSAPLPASARRENRPGTGSRKSHLWWVTADSAPAKKFLSGGREIGQTGDRCVAARQAATANHFGGGRNDRQ
jgi:hypothetical protein